MKLLRSRQVHGFTLSELLISVGVASLLLAALYAGSMSLNRSYAAVDDYFSAHLQQIRIIDYLARDVKRSFSVTTSSDLMTVTCIMPNYIIQSGDPEAVTDSTTIGQRRTPVVAGPPYKAVVDYGTRNTRTRLDGVTTAGSATLTSASAMFTSSDVGNPISCTTVPSGTTILGRNSAMSVTLSKNATATGSGKVFTIYGDGNRTVMDATTTNASTTLTSDTAYFTAADVGKPIVGNSIVAGTTIASVTNSTTAVLSIAAIRTDAELDHHDWRHSRRLHREWKHHHAHRERSLDHDRFEHGPIAAANDRLAVVEHQVHNNFGDLSANFQDRQHHGGKRPAEGWNYSLLHRLLAE